MLTIAVSLLGFGLCKSYRYYVKNQREALIQPPVDLSGGNHEIFSMIHYNQLFLFLFFFFFHEF